MSKSDSFYQSQTLLPSSPLSREKPAGSTGVLELTCLRPQEPVVCVGMQCWSRVELEISHSGTVYAMKSRKHHRSELFGFLLFSLRPEEPLVNHLPSVPMKGTFSRTNLTRQLNLQGQLNNS